MLHTGLFIAAFILFGLAALGVVPGRLVPAGLSCWVLTNLV